MKLRPLLLAAVAATMTVSLAPQMASAQAVSAEWAEKTVPLATFGQFPNIATPRISPDGKMVAAKIRAGGVQMLALIPLTGGDKPRVIARDEEITGNKLGQRQIYGWQWVDSNNLLIFLSSRDNAYGEWYDNTRIVAYNLKTGKTLPLGWDKALIYAGNVLWMSPPDAGPPHLLLERQNNTTAGAEMRMRPEVIDIDVETGKYTNVVRPNILVNSWDADGAGVVRMGSSRDPDNGQLRVLYRPDASSQFRTILTSRPDMHTDPILPSYLLAGSNKAYAINNADGFRAIYEYDLSTMTVGKKVFGVPGYDVDGLSLTPDGTAVQSYHFTDQRTRQRFLEPRLKEVQAILEETFGKGNVRIDSADAKREKIVFTVSELGQAPTIYLFDTVSGNMNRIAYYSDTLKNARMNPVSVRRYKASDGTSIEAIVTMPRHKAGQKNLPLIIMPHGGPWARDDADWDTYQWAQALAENGYVVVQPNFRGSTGYGKDFGKAVDGNWGLRMQDDLNDVIPWLAGDGTIDPRRVCMMGWSYGGYAASRAAQRDGSKYRCAISGAGVHDLPAMVAYDKDYLGAYSARIALGAAGNLREISPSLHAADYSTPILIVHGARDLRVPVDQSRDLVGRLRAAGKVEGKDFVYIEQPLNTHNLLREEDRMQLLNEVLKFLKQHNPA